MLPILSGITIEEFMLRKITENLLEFNINDGRVDVDFYCH